MLWQVGRGGCSFILGCPGPARGLWLLLTPHFDGRNQKGLNKCLLEYASSFQEQLVMLRVWTAQHDMAIWQGGMQFHIWLEGPAKGLWLFHTPHFDGSNQKGLNKCLLEYTSSFHEQSVMLRVWATEHAVAGWQGGCSFISG